MNFTLIPEVPFQFEGTGRTSREIGTPPGRPSTCRHRRLPKVPDRTYYPPPPRPSTPLAIGSWAISAATSGNESSSISPRRKIPVDVKYFDPSYHIRSCPANTVDSLLCELYRANAVHAAMAGKTDMLIGLWHNEFIHVPLALSIGQKKSLSPEDEFWSTVLAITGQDKW